MGAGPRRVCHSVRDAAIVDEEMDVDLGHLDHHPTRAPELIGRELVGTVLFAHG